MEKQGPGGNLPALSFCWERISLRAMIRKLIGAAALLAASLASAPAAAQSQQDELDARYDRALAAGYKALFLCSAIANAERNGATRTPESVMEWELTGIQEPLDAIMGKLSYEIQRDDQGFLRRVAVTWSENMPPRSAVHSGKGCSLAPMGQPFAWRGSRLAASGEGPEQLIAMPWGSERVSLWLGAKIAPLLEQAVFGEYGDGTRTTAVLVKRGDGIAERYAEGFDPLTPQRTWSVAKSIAATLVGAAVQRGEADVNASARLGRSDDDPRRAITIDHLLRMASGRYSDTPGNRTDPLYFGGSTVEETALHWPLIHPPGTVFRYANNDTLMAVEAISHTLADHPPAEFFARLGMNDTVAETDWQGRYILSSQVWSTARDLAKLGQLYLDDGVLPSGERILPQGWVEYVSSPAGPQPEGPLGYGAGVWLFNKAEGVSPDTFAAMGNRGQYVVIVPSRDVVIVRRGEDPPGTRFDIVAFTRDVLAALE